MKSDILFGSMQSQEIALKRARRYACQGERRDQTL